MIAHYEAHWENLNLDPPEKMSLRHVMVPPCADNILGIPEDATTDVKKACYKKQVQRWHPDKFFARFQDRISACDELKIKGRVNEVFRRVSAARARDVTGGT